MTDWYLHNNPPVRTQWNQRRRPPTGLVVIHTTESAPDHSVYSPAEWIRTRVTPGSYHAIADPHEWLPLIHWQWRAFHVGVGDINSMSAGIAIACRADDWPTLPETWINQAIDNAAQAAAAYARWAESRQVVVPALHLTPTQALNGRPGFIGHGELDPARRTDPGPEFPWDMFLDRYRHRHPPTKGDPAMTDHQRQTVMTIQQALVDRGHTIAVDGVPGPKTLAAFQAEVRITQVLRRKALAVDALAAAIQ